MAFLDLTLGNDFVPNIYVWRDTYQPGVDIVHGLTGDDTIGGVVTVQQPVGCCFVDNGPG